MKSKVKESWHRQTGGQEQHLATDQRSRRGKNTKQRTCLDGQRRGEREENEATHVPLPFWLKSYLGPSEHCGSIIPRVSQVSF